MSEKPFHKAKDEADERNALTIYQKKDGFTLARFINPNELVRFSDGKIYRVDEKGTMHRVGEGSK